MKSIYVTVVGMKHHLGSDFLKEGMRLTLRKEPDNEVDTEAIAARLEGLGTVGYVANCYFTVVGECWSAGRLYDRVGDEAHATVKYVLDKGLVCEVEPADILYAPQPIAKADTGDAADADPERG